AARTQTNPRRLGASQGTRSGARNDIAGDEDDDIEIEVEVPGPANPPPLPLTLEQIQIQTALEDQQRARDKHELEMRVMEAQLNGQAVQGVATQQGLREIFKNVEAE